MSKYERFLGVDFGYARVGVAVSDPLGITASAVETIHWNGKSVEKVLERLVELCKALDVSGVVFGLPKRTDNKYSEAEAGVKSFAKTFSERIELPIYFKDERLTSVVANQILRTSQVKKGNRRNVVDQIAAELILQSFLEERRRKV